MGKTTTRISVLTLGALIFSLNAGRNLLLSSSSLSFTQFTTVTDSPEIIEQPNIYAVPAQTVNVTALPSEPLEPVVGNPSLHNFPPPEKGLWIVVESFNEGISGWRKALVQVAMLAQRFNATFVEPQVKDGRLFSPTAVEGNIRLFHVLDPRILRKINTKWATKEDYERLLKRDPPAKVYEWCVGNRKQKDCKFVPGSFQRDQMRHNKALNEAVAALEQYDHVIFRMDRVWMSSLDRLRYRQRLVAPPARAEEIVSNTLEFAPQMHANANLTLQLMNISEQQGYAVIHWRAEKNDIDYLKCAQYIAESQSNMKKDLAERNIEAAKFVLMSSLSVDESHIWAGAKAKAVNTTAQEALHFLMKDRGFEMSSAKLPPQKDLVVYAAVDLILAQRALSFATCSTATSCQKDVRCSSCNWLGKFAGMALKSRSNVDKNDDADVDSRESANFAPGTYNCWPTTTKVE